MDEVRLTSVGRWSVPWLRVPAHRVRRSRPTSRVARSFSSTGVRYGRSRMRRARAHAPRAAPARPAAPGGAQPRRLRPPTLAARRMRSALDLRAPLRHIGSLRRGGDSGRPRPSVLTTKLATTGSLAATERAGQPVPPALRLHRRRVRAAPPRLALRSCRAMSARGPSGGSPRAPPSPRAAGKRRPGLLGELLAQPSWRELRRSPSLALPPPLRGHRRGR